MFDADATQWSVPDGALDRGPAELGKIKGTKTGAADVARCLNSLETLFEPGTLSVADLQRLHSAFKQEHFKNYRVGSAHKRVNEAEYAKAERWYKLEMEVSIMRENDPAGRARVLRLLELDGP